MLCLSLIEKAVFLDPTNPSNICEQAFLCRLLDRMSEAQRHYKNASKIDLDSIQSLTGLLHCQLIEGQKGIEEQLESLEEFHKSTGMSMVCSIIEID